MQQTYGPLTLDLPDGWEEETLVVLKGPVVGNARPSLVVRRVPVPAGTDVGQLLDMEEASLRASVGTLDVVGRTELDVGSNCRALVREVSFPGGPGRLRQVQVALVAGGTFLMFAGTATEDAQFGVMRERVIRLLSGTELSLDGSRKKPAPPKAPAKQAAKKPAKKSAKPAAKKTAKKTAKKPAKKKRR